MNRSRLYKKSKVFTFVVIAVLILSSVLQISGLEARTQSGHTLGFVAYAPTESMVDPTLGDITRDLTLVKQLGFDGVKLWDVTDLYSKGWLDDVLTEAGGLHLKVNVVFQFPPDANGFPPTASSINGMKQVVAEIASITKMHASVAWNSLYAPFDWNMDQSQREAIVRSPEYSGMLEQILSSIKSSDSLHQARVAMDFDPRIGFSLLMNADGYGIMPYSGRLDNVDSDLTRAQINYLAPSGKPVYIDEWGLHTKGGVEWGMASNNQTKARLLVDYAKYVQELGIDWTYFMLTDRIPSIPFESGVDWGIINLDRSPRESATMIQSFLQSRL